jgi:hypothetical protein
MTTATVEKYLPQEVTGLDMAFGGDVSKLMPPYAEIPKEFKDTHNYWCGWQSQWFFEGLKTQPEAKEGIDQKSAMRHLAAIQRSFEPQHEHKSAAVAYLASLWFKQPKK